jgi:hypothetical protein
MLHLILVFTMFFSPTFLTPSSDDGIGIDPNGGKVTSASDHRCTIDPNGGGCTTNTLAGDRGAGLDPDGR